MLVLLRLLVLLAVLAGWCLAYAWHLNSRLVYLPFDQDPKRGFCLGKDGFPVCVKCAAPPDEVVIRLAEYPDGWLCPRCRSEYRKEVQK